MKSLTQILLQARIYFIIMMINCKNCKQKFYLINEGNDLEGKLIKCKHCNEQWIYETKTQYLENRLFELTSDLQKTEAKINLRKKEHEEKISNLENDLNTKKLELDKQKELSDKVTAFENRLKETEKLNLEELELGNKMHKIKKQIRTTSANIDSKNKDIEEKTNYIESRINSYNEDVPNIHLNEEKIKVNSSEIVDIGNGYRKSVNKKINKDDEKKDKKFKFFSPNFIK